MRWFTIPRKWTNSQGRTVYKDRAEDRKLEKIKRQLKEKRKK